MPNTREEMKATEKRTENMAIRLAVLSLRSAIMAWPPLIAFFIVFAHAMATGSDRNTMMVEYGNDPPKVNIGRAMYGKAISAIYIDAEERHAVISFIT